MEPAFQRGDILFLTNQDDPIRAGEIVVFKIKDRDIPIVHRVMKVHEKADGKVWSGCRGCKNSPVMAATMLRNLFRWKC
jgi:signal peptidase